MNEQKQREIEAVRKHKQLLLEQGYSKQRINNWLKKGVPAAIKLKHMGLFL